MWDILHLPAILGDGSPLWPEMFPLDKLEATRRQMGGALFDAMYMGHPESLTGDIFQAGWFKPCQLGVMRDPMNGQLVPCVKGDEDVPFDRLLFYQFWDLAISSKETADYTCCVTVALDPEKMDVYVVDVERGHWSFEVTQQQIAKLGAQWQPIAVGIESVAYQAAAVQQAVANTMLPVIEVKVDKDKVTRARLPAARAEAGKVYVLDKSPWTGPFLDELASFPTGAHDDMVDAFSGSTALAATYVRSSMELW